MGRVFKNIGSLFAVSVLVGSLLVGIGTNKAYAAGTVGSVVDLAGDDLLTSTKVPIGFNFDLYGTTYTEANVTTNGVFDFNGSNYNTGGSMPSTSYMAAIAPFWADLYTEHGEAKSIYYKTIGDPGTRKFVLQWTNMNLCCDTASPAITFQMILFEGTNKVHFEYIKVSEDTQIAAYNPTIGIQKDHTTANTYSNSGSASVPISNSALEFTPNGSGGYTDNGHAVAYDPTLLTVEGIPGAPTLYMPTESKTNVATVNTLLAWDAVPGATKYDVVVANTPLLLSNSVSSTQTIANSWRFDNTLNLSTTYYWRVAAGNDAGFTYSDIHSFTTIAATENTPNVPTSVAPTSLTTGLVQDPTALLATPFTFSLSDTDSAQKVGYEIVYSTTSNPNDSVIDYISPLGDQGARSYLYGSTKVGHYLKGSATTRLANATDYYVFVRAYDELGAVGDFNTQSTPSFSYTSTPADDNDGTAIASEDAAPNGGDANNDGLQDSWQPNVASFVDPVTNKYSVLQIDGLNPGDCKNQSASISAEAVQSSQDGAYNYPAGLMNFTATCLTPGATAKITQIFYGTYTGTLVARKYNSVTKTYTDIPNAQVGTTTIGGQPAVRVEYFVTDGGALDQDGTANGTIVDPSGPAVLGAVSAPNTGVQTKSVLTQAAYLYVGTALMAVAFAKRSKNSK